MRGIERKWVEVHEIIGEGKLELKRGQRILDTRVVHEVVEVKKPQGLGAPHYRTVLPGYKTIIVIECVEYAGDNDD